jgi:hypothetical protein
MKWVKRDYKIMNYGLRITDYGLQITRACGMQGLGISVEFKI